MPTQSNRITHVIGALIAGGAERFVVDLLLAMQDQGADVGLFALSNRNDPAGIQMRRRLDEASIPTKVGPTRRIRFSTILWYLRALQKTRPGILHMHTSNTVLIHEITRPASSADPLLFRTIHNTELPQSRLKVIALKRSRARLIACSSAAADAYSRKLGQDSKVIPNGIHFNWSVRDARTATVAKGRLGLDKNSFHVIHIGRMEKSGSRLQKAQDLLIQAWRRAEMGSLGAMLHFLGDGPDRQELESAASGDSSIKFHGVVPNVREWLLAADCFAMPSRWEGLPIAGMEAVGTGIPLIFSDINSLRELGAPAAFWVRADDAAELGTALRAMRQSPCLPKAKDVMAWRMTHDIGRTAQQYLEVYEQAV